MDLDQLKQDTVSEDETCSYQLEDMTLRMSGVLSSLEQEWNESVKIGIETCLCLADLYEEKGFDPSDVIKDLIKIHDKKPFADFDRNLSKLIFKYVCRISHIDPTSNKGKDLADSILAPKSAEEEKELKERLDKKARIRSGQEPGYMTYHLKKYSEENPERNIHYTF